MYSEKQHYSSKQFATTHTSRSRVKQKQLEAHSQRFHLCSRRHHHARWLAGVPAYAEREPSEAERWGIHHPRSRRPLQRASAGTHSQHSGRWAGRLSAWAAMRKKGCQVSLGHPGNVSPPAVEAENTCACQTEMDPHSSICCSREAAFPTTER